MTDEEELAAVLATIPARVSHLPLRLLVSDLAILIDSWKDVREPPNAEGLKRYKGLPTSADVALIDDLIVRLMSYRRGRSWYVDTENDGREQVLDRIEMLAKSLVDDSAQYAILKTVDTYRLHRRHEETDDEAIERQALEGLREMSRHRWNERTAIVQAVRADLLAGRMTTPAAIERIGLPAWTALCATLSDDELQRVLGGWTVERFS